MTLTNRCISCSYEIKVRIVLSSETVFRIKKKWMQLPTILLWALLYYYIFEIIINIVFTGFKFSVSRFSHIVNQEVYEITRISSADSSFNNEVQPESALLFIFPLSLKRFMKVPYIYLELSTKCLAGWITAQYYKKKHVLFL